MRPLAKSQYVARQAAGMVIVAIVLFIWFYGSLLRDKLAVFAALRAPEAARRFLIFAVVVVLAILPSDIYLTRTWSSYLDVVRAEVLAKGGVIAFEDSPLSRHPYDLLVEAWILPGQSLALQGQARRRHHRAAQGFQVLAALPAGGPLSARQVHVA